MYSYFFQLKMSYVNTKGLKYYLTDEYSIRCLEFHHCSYINNLLSYLKDRSTYNCSIFNHDSQSGSLKREKGNSK